jgi:hypothetical protein
MDTTDKRNSVIRDNKENYDLDKMKQSDDDRREIAERGYTIRNGHNPNKPNPDQNEIGYDEDLDDLDDDFHNDRDLDLDDTNDDLYIIELESGELDDRNLEVENDEFDNPSDALGGDFSETEDDLEDIDQDDDEDEYIEDDVQEDDEEDDYPENDPRKF